MSLGALLILSHVVMLVSGASLALMVLLAWQQVKVDMPPKKKLPLPAKKEPRKWGSLIAAGLAVAQLVAGVVLIIAGHEVHGAILLGTGGMTGFAAKQPAVLLLLVLGLSSVACGPKPLQVAYATLNTASAEWTRWADAEQDAITAKARKACDCVGTGSSVVCRGHGHPACDAARAEARPKFIAFMVKANKVELAIYSAYKALAIASLGGGHVDKAAAAVGAALTIIEEARK